MKFNEYYSYYLTLHQNKVNRRLHVLGQVSTILYVVLCLTKLPLILIMFSPFVVYPFAWSGHYFYEKNKPAAFSNPVFAKMADWVMLKDWILGRVER